MIGKELSAPGVGVARARAIERAKLYAGRFALPAAVLLMIALFAVLEPRYATVGNLTNASRQASLLALAAMAQAFPILVGGFNIAQGQEIAATTIVIALVANQYGVLPGIAAGILFCGLLGTISGTVISRLKVDPFIVTLGMLSLARGFSLLITNGQAVRTFPDGYDILGSAFWGPIPLPVVIAALALVLGHVVLSWTRFGRYIYALGGNADSAHVSGVNVALYRTLAYTMCGLITGVVAAVLSSRTMSAEPNLGEGIEFEAIAAVVIGGVALGGGQGNVGNVLTGVVLIAFLSNGLNLVGVGSYVQHLFIGTVIVVAVILDRLRYRAR